MIAINYGKVCYNSALILTSIHFSNDYHTTFHDLYQQHAPPLEGYTLLKFFNSNKSHSMVLLQKSEDQKITDAKTQYSLTHSLRAQDERLEDGLGSI